MTDKQKLRGLAESATGGDWEYRLGMVRTLPDADGYVPIAVAPNAPKNWRGQRDMNMEFIAAAKPSAVIALLDQCEALHSVLGDPDEIKAEPASDYDSLRKQFTSLLMLANSKCRQAKHWRAQSSHTMHQTILATAANVNAERDTNAIMTDALDQAEADIDRLNKELEACKADAERYRYQFSSGEWDYSTRWICGDKVSVDAEIDAVLARDSQDG